MARGFGTLEKGFIAARQSWRRLSELLDDVVVFPVAGDHDAVASVPQFPATLVAAIDSVVTRAA